MKDIAGASSSQYQMIADNVGKQVLQCGINYYNNAPDSDVESPRKAMVLQSYALSIAVGQLTKDRCKENYDILKQAVDNMPPTEVAIEARKIKEELRKFCQLPDKISHSVNLLNKTKPLLQTINVDNIIIPYIQENFVIDEILANDASRNILRDAMKFYAEQAKNQLSLKIQADITSQLDEFGEDDEGNEIELDLVVTQEQLKPVLANVFQKAIDITKDLLKRNGLSGSDLDKLILVGGPTYSPVLREMLREQIIPNVDTDIDPMTAVAKGAALFASGIDNEVKSVPAIFPKNCSWNSFAAITGGQVVKLKSTT